MRLGMSRLEAKCLLQGGGRLVEPPELSQNDAELGLGGRVVGPQLRRLLVAGLCLRQLALG